MSSFKSPKNWSEWNNTKHFTDYSRDSGTGKFVRFTIAALLFVPVRFLAYMTTIQVTNATGNKLSNKFQLVLIGIQAWYIVPIDRKNNQLNKDNLSLRVEINSLKYIYK